MTEIRKHPSLLSQSSIDEAIDKIPEGKTGAVILFADVDSTSMRYGVVAKIEDKWSFAGVLEKEWDGEWHAEGQVRFSW
jgi:hypothetical protein